MMKKKLVTLDKNAHWWVKEKLDWATQDKDGNWWIIPGSEFPENKVTEEDKMKIDLRRSGQGSLSPNVNFYLLIIATCLLAVSLALNFVYYIM